MELGQKLVGISDPVRDSEVRLLAPSCLTLLSLLFGDEAFAPLDGAARRALLAQVWDLGDRPSLRFVRDTLRMRRMGQVQLVLAGPLPTYVARLTPPAEPAASPSPSPAAAAGQAGLGPAGEACAAVCHARQRHLARRQQQQEVVGQGSGRGA